MGMSLRETAEVLNGEEGAAPLVLWKHRFGCELANCTPLVVAGACSSLQRSVPSRNLSVKFSHNEGC